MRGSSSLLIGLVLIGLMLVWGGSFIAIKVGLRYFSPYELMLARFIPSALLFLPIALWTQHRAHDDRKFWGALSPKGRIGLLAASLLAVPGYHFSINFSETMIPAGWASLVISLNPACIAIFAALFLRESIGLKRWLGVLCAFLALLFIALTHDVFSDRGEPVSLWTRIGGMAVTLGAVVSFGGFSIISKRLVRDHDPMIVLAWAFGIGTVVLLPGFRFNLIKNLIEAPAELWWAVAYLSIGCTVIAFSVWFWVLRKWQASRAGVFIYLVPLFALIFGRWLLKEPLDFAMVIGAIGVLGGVLLAGSVDVQRKVFTGRDKSAPKRNF